jgi:hypothetical protein
MNVRVIEEVLCGKCTYDAKTEKATITCPDGTYTETAVQLGGETFLPLLPCFVKRFHYKTEDERYENSLVVKFSKENPNTLRYEQAFSIASDLDDFITGYRQYVGRTIHDKQGRAYTLKDYLISLEYEKSVSFGKYSQWTSFSPMFGNCLIYGTSMLVANEQGKEINYEFLTKDASNIISSDDLTHEGTWIFYTRNYLIGATRDIKASPYISAKAAAQCLGATLTADQNTKEVSLTRGETTYDATATLVNDTLFVPLAECFTTFGYAVSGTDGNQATLYSLESEYIIPLNYDRLVNDYRALVNRPLYNQQDQRYLVKQIYGWKKAPLGTSQDYALFDCTQFGNDTPEEVSIDLLTPKGIVKTFSTPNYSETWLDSIELLRYSKAQVRSQMLQATKVAKQAQAKQAAEIQKRHPKWNRKYIDLAVSGRVCVGMPADLVVVAFGNPIERNRMAGSWGTHEQWVYDEAYIYIANGVVDGWQD